VQLKLQMESRELGIEISIAGIIKKLDLLQLLPSEKQWNTVSLDSHQNPNKNYKVYAIGAPDNLFVSFAKLSRQATFLERQRHM
jgi:hypothetical protein